MKFLLHSAFCLLVLCFCFQMQAQSNVEKASFDGKLINSTIKQEPHASVVSAVGCSGTPNGGTAVGPAYSPCSGSDFNVTASGQDFGASISQQWESSPDGSTWSPVVGQTGNTMTTSITADTYFRLNVYCSTSGLSGYSNSVFVTLASTNLMGVSALVLDSTRAAVYWDVTPSAGFFKIQYRVKGTSSWTLINVPNKDYQRVAWIISGLTKNTIYQYRARMQCPDLTAGPYTSIQEFTTFTTSPCEIPAASKIVFMSIPDKVRIFIDYEPAAEKFDVRWRVLGTTQPIDNKVFKNATSVLTGLTPATDYEYRVRTKCSGVWTGYSSWTTFTTNDVPAPIAPLTAAQRTDQVKVSTSSMASKVALYPNPVNQTLFVEFTGTGSKHMRLMNMSGKVVLDQIIQENLEVLDVATYPQGTYFMQVIFENGEVLTQKLIKQ